MLDEPTTGLDPETRRRIWELVHKEKKSKTIILTTHSMEEVSEVSSFAYFGEVKTIKRKEIIKLHELLYINVCCMYMLYVYMYLYMSILTDHVST